MKIQTKHENLGCLNMFDINKFIKLTYIKVLKNNKKGYDLFTIT